MNTYLMFRDIGINIYGKYSIVDYSLSVLNGHGANATESTDAKEVLLRLNFNLSDNLIVGTSG